jgi:hypothetical protein
MGSHLFNVTLLEVFNCAGDMQLLLFCMFAKVNSRRVIHCDLLVGFFKLYIIFSFQIFLGSNVAKNNQEQPFCLSHMPYLEDVNLPNPARHIELTRQVLASVDHTIHTDVQP